MTNLVFAPLEALLVLFVVQRIPPIRLSGALSWMFAGEASVGLFFGAQALIGSVGVAFAPAVAKRMRLGRMYVAGLVMLGGGFAVVSFLQSFWAVIPTGIALTGVAWVNVALSTLRQRLTPEPLLGRVIAASRTLVWIGLPLGAGLGGVLGGVYGLVPVYATGAAAVLVVAVLLRFTVLWHSPMTAAGPVSPSVPAATTPSLTLAERIVLEARGERSGSIGIRDGSLLAIAAVLWGSSFLFVARGLESVHPAVITSGRLLLAAVVLGAFPAARQRIDRHDWPTLITMSLLWMAVPLMLIAIAQQWIDSSVAGMVSGGVPLFSALIAAALLGRLPGARRLVGLAIGFVGLALIVGQSVETSSAATSGAGLVITAALCLGFAMHLIVPLQQKYGSLPVLLRAFLVAAGVTLPFGLAGLTDSTYSASSTTAILVLGVLGTAAAYITMAVLVGHRGMTGAAVATYFVPHIAVVLGVVAANESVSGIVLTGIAVMLLGIFLTQELPAGPPPRRQLPTVVPASADGEA